MAAIEGYKARVAFTDGAGDWDNNGGHDYVVGMLGLVH